MLLTSMRLKVEGKNEPFLCSAAATVKKLT